MSPEKLLLSTISLCGVLLLSAMLIFNECEAKSDPSEYPERDNVLIDNPLSELQHRAYVWVSADNDIYLYNHVTFEVVPYVWFGVEGERFLTGLKSKLIERFGNEETVIECVGDFGVCALILQ